MKFLTSVATGCLIAALAGPAWAGDGALDFLDPCIKAKDEFRTERILMVKQLDQAVADADQAAAPAEYKDAWMKAKRSDLRVTFDDLVAPTLKDSGVSDLDK